MNIGDISKMQPNPEQSTTKPIGRSALTKPPLIHDGNSGLQFEERPPSYGSNPEIISMSDDDINQIWKREEHRRQIFSISGRKRSLDRHQLRQHRNNKRTRS